jgi:broad specificity phosphatase PhoE
MKKTVVRALFAALLAALACRHALAQQEIILVRHAELQGAAMADPKSLPLSADGKARAERLATLLRDAHVGAIYATDFVRTQETARPLARDLEQRLVVVPKGDAREFAARLRKEHAGDVVLVVGHTDTLPGLLEALGHPFKVKLDAQDYGNLFIVTPRPQGAPGFLRLRY